MTGRAGRGKRIPRVTVSGAAPVTTGAAFFLAQITRRDIGFPAGGVASYSGGPEIEPLGPPAPTLSHRPRQPLFLDSLGPVGILESVGCSASLSALKSRRMTTCTSAGCAGQFPRQFSQEAVPMSRLDDDDRFEDEDDLVSDRPRKSKNAFPVWLIVLLCALPVGVVDVDRRRVCVVLGA
jgi:hypothetical protein